jgi:hypothetical protein
MNELIEEGMDGLENQVETDPEHSGVCVCVVCVSACYYISIHTSIHRWKEWQSTESSTHLHMCVIKLLYILLCIGQKRIRAHTYLYICIHIYISPHTTINTTI